MEKGKYYGVIGGNGSGKSTICRLIMQLYQPVSGTVVYERDAQNSNRIVYIEDKPIILYDDITRSIVGSSRYDKDKLGRILEETELKTPAEFDEVIMVEGGRHRKVFTHRCAKNC